MISHNNCDLNDKIGAVIVTYNSNMYIDKCLQSLCNSLVKVQYIVIIDNCSTEGLIYNNIMPDVVREILLDYNHGFGFANNIGVSSCIKEGCKWILLVNPDAWICDDSLVNALNCLNQNENSIAAGGIEYEYDSNNYSRYTLMHSYKAIESNDILLVDGTVGKSINGAFVLLRSSGLMKIGMFDPIYKMYFEESDFFRRARFAGWDILLNPNVRYHHKISASYIDNNNNFMPTNKLIEITRSEAIHRLTDPNTNIFLNILRLLKQFFLIIVTYRSNLDLAFIAIKSMFKAPIIHSCIKWYRDRNRKYGIYVDIIGQSRS